MCRERTRGASSADWQRLPEILTVPGGLYEVPGILPVLAATGLPLACEERITGGGP